MKQIRQTWMRTFYTTLGLLSLTFLLIGCIPSSHTLENDSTSHNKVGTKTKSIVISNGVKVDDLDLSGTLVSEAPSKIDAWANDKLEETRVLLYNEKEIPISLKDMGIEVDTQKIVEEAQRIPGLAVSSVLKVDPLAASQALQERLKKFNRPAKDAFYKIEMDNVVIHPSESGRTVDVDRLIRDILKFNLSEVPLRIDLPMEEVPATVTTESIKALAFDSVIGEFTTKFSVKEENRSANLTAAAKALDGKVILPGGTFSFNETVGPREPETGYKEAYVIVNGEYVQGTGGGICQVSSTLYNAVLLSNLEIMERKPHEVVVSYVPAGQDATVSYPNLDFKFKNNSLSMVYLRTDVKAGVLTVRIWGKKTGLSISIERQVEKELNYKVENRLDPKLSAGRVVQEQKGSKGIVVNTWKVTRDKDGNEGKQFLGRDWYAPTNQIFRVGTRGISET
ncbi:VanW domain-containing protein [Desulfosporosinus burensis]